MTFLRSAFYFCLCAGLLFASHSARAQSTQFHRAGDAIRLEDIPFSKLSQDIARLSPPLRETALARLSNVSFPKQDYLYLRVNSQGRIYYEDPALTPQQLNRIETEKSRLRQVRQRIAKRAIADIDPSQVFMLHSRPAASRKVWVNFKGWTVTGKAWNAASGYSTHEMAAWSLDADRSTFNQEEMNVIAEVWKAISEDYAPFNIDVTTEQPSSFDDQVGHILISPRIDLAGHAIYPPGAGGVAYLDVWGTPDFSYYRPALVFPENLGNDAKNISEAASHELGHNLSLNHDGTSSLGYYAGHGSGNTSWAPIMGVGYYTNVTQWSSGEYFDANNSSQNDVVAIGNRLGFRPDDHSNGIAGATGIIVTNGTITSTTPVSDPGDQNTANKGIINSAADSDYFFVDVPVSGTINLTITPDHLDSFSAAGLRNANLDIEAVLYNSTGSIVVQNDSSTDTSAQLIASVPSGRYYVAVSGVGFGNPSTDGYSDYGSMGRYFINGTVPVAVTNFNLSLLKSGTGAGVVSSSPSGISCGASCNANFPSGSTVVLTASASTGSVFSGWSGDCSGTSSTCQVTMAQARSATATFDIQPTNTGLGQAVDNTALTWTTGSRFPWFSQSNKFKFGTSAAASARIGNSQSTFIETKVTGPKQLTFYWAVSSESRYDFLEFVVDGVLKRRISGKSGWTFQSFSVPSGSHTLRWRYRKDGNTSSGSDRGWLDNVKLK
jgi:hypothetical protein